MFCTFVIWVKLSLVWIAERMEDIEVDKYDNDDDDD